MKTGLKVKKELRIDASQKAKACHVGAEEEGVLCRGEFDHSECGLDNWVD